jgi:hypothetical protein
MQIVSRVERQGVNRFLGAERGDVGDGGQRRLSRRWELEVKA